MVNFSGLRTKWESIQDNLIAFHNEAVTVYYEQKNSGTSVSYDDFLNEGLDPNTPGTFSGVTELTKSPVTITGAVYYNNGGINNGDIFRYPIGYFQTEDAVIVCKIADATISGENIFLGSKYVLVGTEKYIVNKISKDGLGTPYVYNIGVKLSNIGE